MPIRAENIGPVHFERDSQFLRKGGRTEGDYNSLIGLYEMLERQQKGPVCIRHPFRVRAKDLGLGGGEEKFVCPKITGVVSKIDEAEGEVVALKIGNKKTLVRRFVPKQDDETEPGEDRGNSIWVVADPDGLPPPRNVLSIVIPVSSEKGSKYDRDVVWIRTGDEPVFTFYLNANHGLSAEELTKLHVAAMNKSIKALKKLLAVGI